VKALPRPGLHHFAREVDGGVVRYHLRVEHDGSGTLLANASSAVRLSPSGVTIAHALLRDQRDAAVQDAQRAFVGASTSQIAEDVEQVARVIATMHGAGSGRYPILNLDDPESNVHRRTLSAPLAADLTATATDGESARAILRALWEIGIPQVVFDLPAGAPSSHLVALVEHAEDLGLIAGVRALATDVESAVEDLARAGLDHLDLRWSGPDPSVHDAVLGEGDFARAAALVERGHELELCPVAVTALLGPTLDVLDELAADLAARRIGAWTVFGVVSLDGRDTALSPSELRQAATTASELADRLGLHLLWAPPTEVAAKAPRPALLGPRAMGETSVRIEADGSVIAPFGAPAPAGNLLRDPWQAIWQSDVFRRYREAVDRPSRCDACPELAICSAGCPASRSTWATLEEKGS
jgi:radical SAM protein with 4Fe4S-binding SPASM domain